MAGVIEACSLERIRRELDGREIADDGQPLNELDRLVLLAARVIPSEYRVVVVVDPGLWVDEERGGAWRRAVVRASVGRTALWLTRDLELASRGPQWQGDVEQQGLGNGRGGPIWRILAGLRQDGPGREQNRPN